MDDCGSVRKVKEGQLTPHTQSMWGPGAFIEKVQNNVGPAATLGDFYKYGPCLVRAQAQKNKIGLVELNGPF